MTPSRCSTGPRTSDPTLLARSSISSWTRTGAPKSKRRASPNHLGHGKKR
ncbi:unnamed protein product [Rhizoctonia solani]|uniref:Uncharacterized protein n=1 Tax=Rhizoctonia solani TaxID=456999 RepID=A0A8H3HXS7_9AGAM|nr:unnamed protein product [Rhizoctonia solani]